MIQRYDLTYYDNGIARGTFADTNQRSDHAAQVQTEAAAVALPPETRSGKGIPPALWALTISAFAIGTTEFVAVGILPTIAESLNVSVSASGLLVSIYALGVAVGGPILTVLTSKVPRKPLLVSADAAVRCRSILRQLLRRTSSHCSPPVLFPVFAHAVFFGVGATIAPTLVAPDKKPPPSRSCSPGLRSPLSSVYRWALLSASTLAGAPHSAVWLY